MCSVSGRLLSWKIVASGGCQLATHGTQGFEPGAEKDGIDRHQRLSHLAAHCFPPGVIRVVARQGTGGWKQAGIARLRRLQHGPELRSQGGAVGFQGITQDRKFAGCGLEKAVEEVINLGGIDGQEGEAGVELLAWIIRLFVQFALERRIDPAAVARIAPRCQGLEACPHPGVAGPDPAAWVAC